jgi:multidrug efflux pump subunit AcrB
MVHYLLAAEVERYGGKREADADSARAKKSIAPRVALVVAAAALAGAYFALRHLPAGAPAWAADAGAWVAANDGPIGKAALFVVGGAAALYLVGALDLIWRTHHLFNRGFESLRRLYGGFLAWALGNRLLVTLGFAALVAVSCALTPLIGRDFFPSVDAGQIRLHVRAPAGTRIEETARRYAAVEEVIRAAIPPAEVVTVLDNIGIPNSGINLSLSDGSVMSPADGEILVALTEKHAPTERYVKRLRRELPERFPDLVFFFQPPDIATQVLNFGLPAAIDVQISGPARNAPQNEVVAREILDDVRRVPGAADARLQQVSHTPDVRVNVDRALAAEMGVTQRDVAGDLLISLSSSTQTAPNFWMDPRTGVNYSILVQTPQTAINSIDALTSTPVPSPAGGDAMQTPHLLADVATVGRGATPTNTTHYDISPTCDVLLGVAGADLGSVADGVRAAVEKRRAELPRGSTIALRGQIQSMDASFGGLAFGLVFAIVLVYLLMVVNFQSWLDPLIILMALPGALSGILWMLFVTGTTISVPALMGAMMSVGVATANSILMITFANDKRLEGFSAHDAALAAGLTRLRPVVMTALAMIIGMLPMSLGLSEGGEQNAPLGRAVIGGLAMATFMTLFFVPVVYSALRRKAPHAAVEEELK